MISDDVVAVVLAALTAALVTLLLLLLLTFTVKPLPGGPPLPPVDVVVV